MRRFVKEKNADAVIATAFMILILFTLAAVVYAGAAVYAKYESCETELQRLATVTVDESTVNKNVRDLSLDLPDSAESLLADNLAGAGWTQKNEAWEKYDGDTWLYSLEDVQVTVDGTLLRIDTTFEMPLPWNIGGQATVTIPIMVRSRILFI